MIHLLYHVYLAWLSRDQIRFGHCTVCPTKTLPIKLKEEEQIK